MGIIDEFGMFLRKITTPKDEYGKPSGGFWPSRIRSKAWEMCEGLSGKLMEAGCGEGLFLSMVDKKRFEVYGVEYDKDIVALANLLLEKKGIKVIQGDLKDLDFEDNTFDVVVCINTLYNLKDIGEVMSAIKELSRVCRSGGSIIIDFKNKLNPVINTQYRLAKYTDPNCQNPLKTYKPKEIRKILKDNNLEIDKIASIGFFIKAHAPVLVIKARKK